MLAQNKNFNLAKKLLKKANQIDPNHLSVLNNLGLVFYELGEFQLAVDCYEKAIKIKKNIAPIYNNLGNSFKELDRRNKNQIRSL